MLQTQLPQLPPGLFLFGAVPAAARRSFSELTFDLAQLMAKIAPVQAPPTP
jgi:hypothetical protein